MRAASLMGLFLLKNRYVPFACCASGTFFCSKCPPFPLWILYGYLRDSIGIWMVCRGMPMGCSVNVSYWKTQSFNREIVKLSDLFVVAQERLCGLACNNRPIVKLSNRLICV